MSERLLVQFPLYRWLSLFNGQQLIEACAGNLWLGAEIPVKLWTWEFKVTCKVYYQLDHTNKLLNKLVWGWLLLCIRLPGQRLKSAVHKYSFTFFVVVVFCSRFRKVCFLTCCVSSNKLSIVFIGTTNIDYQRCWRKVKRRFFRKKVKTVCEKLTRAIAESSREKKTALFKSKKKTLNYVSLQ